MISTVWTTDMLADFNLWPESASSASGRVDTLFLFLVSVTIFFVSLISLLILIFVIKYRRRADVERAKNTPHKTLGLEIAWSVIPLLIVLASFFWGATIYIDLHTPPTAATEIYVVGKQWMWKLYHPGGQREINTLHVPLGRAVKLTMISEDVIHSFYIPAFRVKQDVLPGRFTQLWFEATKTGEFHLFCAEYCGTEHSKMIGKVVVMEPLEFQDWLRSGEENVALAVEGRDLFEKLNCHTCHGADSGYRGPNLEGLYGREVELKSGAKVVADEAYLRESILKPGDKIVAGYEALMPTFQSALKDGERGQEETVLKLIAYIRSLGHKPDGAAEDKP